MVLQGVSQRFYVCGLREVRNAVKLHRVVSVVMAPNIDQMDATDGILMDIKEKCEEQHVPLIFALSRKRLGQIYGNRKRVSAVALLDIRGIEDLHEEAVVLMTTGRKDWEECLRAGLTPPCSLLGEEDGEEE